MKNPEVGKVLSLSEEAERDAIHVAIVAMIANERLIPGQHVGIADKDKNRIGTSADPIGIVDPFIRKRYIFEGERVYLFFYPQTITSLRHNWTHPSFEPLVQVDAKEAARKWLENWGLSVLGMSFDQLMIAAKNWIERGDYHPLGFDTPSECYEQKEEFWKNYEIYTGNKTIAEDQKTSFFSCSC